MAKTRTAPPSRPAGKARQQAATPQKQKRTGVPKNQVDLLDQRLAAWQRRVLAVVVVLAGVAVWRPLTDPFMLPKLSVLLFGAVVLVALAGVRAARQGRATLPAGLPVWLLTAVLTAMAVATVAAPRPMLSLVGQRGRYGGLLAYLAFALIFLVVVRLYAEGRTRGLHRALLLALGLVTAYGLLQAAGGDPYSWSSGGLSQTFSTMGNINFASGYTASLMPAAAAVAVLPGWSPAWRWTAAGLLIAAAGYLVAAQSAQGPLAAAAGLLVVGAAWMQSRRARSTGCPKRSRLWLLAALPVAAVAALSVSRIADEVAAGLSERRYFWGAALRVVADSPVLGTGLESFRDYFTLYRAPEHAVFLGFDGADSVHSVPLGMLVAGGVPLALAYLAFVGFTGYVLVQGLWRASGPQLPALAAFGGVWAAYQVQSLVSLDVVAVTFLHFLSAGMIFALARPAQGKALELRLRPASRGALLPTPAGPRRTSAAVMAVVVLLGLTSLWVSSRPLRADLTAAAVRATDDQQRAVELLDRAVQLAPWEAEYRILQGQARLDAGLLDGATESVYAVAEMRRGSSRLALGAADFALRQGDLELQLRWIEEALRRDPVNPQLLDEAAELFRGRGDAARADELTQRAAFLRENHSNY